jgi:hypothetical protein
MRKLFLCISLILLISCNREKSAPPPAGADAAGPPAKTVSDAADQARARAEGGLALEITPGEAASGAVLSLEARGFDIAGADVSWMVNGIEASTERSFRASGLRKGDTVRAVARSAGRQIDSNTLVIRNAPPEITGIRLVPETFRPGERLGVEVAGSDLDGDEVVISYEWTKNGEPAGEGERLEASLARGDEFTVKATPFDGEEYGSPMVLRRKVGNFPPVIAEDLSYGFDGSVYTYQVKAEDPDGDPLSYELSAGPEGMTIDPSTGQVRWEVPAEFYGEGKFTVSVRDGQGGESTRDLVIRIMPEASTKN